MRIEAYSQVQQLYSSQKVSRENSVQKKGQHDQVQFSTQGLELQKATAAVKGASDIRYDVVEPLKKAIQDGTYNVSGDSFADKLLEKYAAL